MSPPTLQEETREERKARHAEKRRRKQERQERREERAKRSRTNPPATTESPRSPGSPTAENARRAENPDVFVWKKKDDALRKRGIEVTERDEIERKRDLQTELESAKQRRAQREAERADWEAQQALASRQREQEENEGWHQQETSFQGKQHHIRQAIRLRQNRPTVCDSMARNVRLDLLDVQPDTRTPAEYLDRQTELRIADLEELKESVEVELDFIPDCPTEGDNEVFNRRFRHKWWTCVKSVVINKLEAVRADEMGGDAGGIHCSVRGDVVEMLKGKSLEQLLTMEAEIAEKLDGNQNGADGSGGDDLGEVDFWMAALSQIRSSIARHKLSEMNEILGKERQLRIRNLPKEDATSLQEPQEGHIRESMADEEMYLAEAAKGIKQDEERFDDEVDLKEGRREACVAGFSWNDKYRPRKPRYFNRLHTGYSWTKYNRTHYDHNNPPPKTVQGYKFNIFYPDLIDKTKTPTFTISKTENPEVSVITFKASPPYEELAFKIVNRSWERSHRRGFRCSFDRGILHLWFNFQRYYYKR